MWCLADADESESCFYIPQSRGESGDPENIETVRIPSKHDQPTETNKARAELVLQDILLKLRIIAHMKPLKNMAVSFCFLAQDIRSRQTM